MGALLERFRVSGVALAALPDGRIQATGALTDTVRATIREHKAAILAELAANDPPPVATPSQSDELRRLLAVVAADWSAEEQAEALAAALADPESALRSFRALVAERGASTPPRASLDPSCRSCANLAPGGRCLAAWRGESFGRGIATTKTYAPSEPDRPLCCGPYVPGPNDPDRRSGRERW